MEDESSDALGKRRIYSPTIYGENGKTVSKSIPISLKSFLCGKRRAIRGDYPETTNRVLWSIASDVLACCPFRAYLERHEQVFDMHCLNFWSDVRAYLDVDDSSTDGLGRPMKKTLANK